MEIGHLYDLLLQADIAEARAREAYKASIATADKARRILREAEQEALRANPVTAKYHRGKGTTIDGVAVEENEQRRIGQDG